MQNHKPLENREKQLEQTNLSNDRSVNAVGGGETRARPTSGSKPVSTPPPKRNPYQYHPSLIDTASGGGTIGKLLASSTAKNVEAETDGDKQRRQQQVERQNCNKDSNLPEATIATSELNNTNKETEAEKEQKRQQPSPKIDLTSAYVDDETSNSADENEKNSSKQGKDHSSPKKPCNSPRKAKQVTEGANDQNHETKQQQQQKPIRRTTAPNSKKKDQQHLIVGRRHIMNIHEKSCYCFEYSHDEQSCNLRRALFRTFDHFVFDVALVVLILYNLCYFIIDSPFGRGLAGGTELVEYSEYCIQGLFSLEILIKIYSLGFALHPYAYCRDPLRFIELVVVVCGFIAIPLYHTQWRVLRNLKLIRLFRLLERVMQYVPELRGIFDALVGGLPRFADIVLFVSFLVIALSIVGVQLFRGEFDNRCYFVPPTTSIQDVGLTNESAYPSVVHSSSSWYLYNNLNFSDQRTIYYGASRALTESGVFNATMTTTTAAVVGANGSFVGFSSSSSSSGLTRPILDPLDHWPCARSADGEDEIQAGGLTPCPRGGVCLKNSSLFRVPFANFDHLGYAAFTVLKLTSIDGIQEDIRRMSYTTGSVSALYGILIVFLISFCAMNFFIALLSWEYDIACQRHLPPKKKISLNTDDEDKQNFGRQQQRIDAASSSGSPLTSPLTTSPNSPSSSSSSSSSEDDDPAIVCSEQDRKVKERRKKRRERAKRRKIEQARLANRRKLEQRLPPWADPIPLEDEDFLAVDDDDDDSSSGGEGDHADNNARDVNQQGQKIVSASQPPAAAPAASVKLLRSFLQSFLRCINALRLFAYKFLVGTSPFFWFSVFVTTLNVAILAIFFEGMSEELANIFNWINIACGIFFLAEMVLKLFCLMPRHYFSLKTNIFEFLLACAVIAELATLDGTNSSQSVFAALRAVRMLRIFSLAVKFERPRQTLLTVASGAKASFMLFLVLVAYVTIAALFAVYLFEDTIPSTQRPNFTDLPQSILAMFIILAGENWVSTVTQVMHGSNGAAAIFFFVYFFFGTYLLLNLFVVIVIASYKHTAEEIGEWRLREQQEKNRRKKQLMKEKERERKLQQQLHVAAIKDWTKDDDADADVHDDERHVVVAGDGVDNDGNDGDDGDGPPKNPDDHQLQDEFEKNILRAVDNGANAAGTNGAAVPIDDNSNDDPQSRIPPLNVPDIIAMRNHNDQAHHRQQEQKFAPPSSSPPPPPTEESGASTSRLPRNDESSNLNSRNPTVRNSPDLFANSAVAAASPSGASSPSSKSLGRTVREKQQKTLAHRLALLMGNEYYLTSDAVKASLIGDSCYVFAPTNCFRTTCAVVVSHPFFEFLTTLVILESLIFLGFETKKNVEDISYLLSGGLASDVFRINNIVISCWFTLEMFLKMIAFGVVIREPQHIPEENLATTFYAKPYFWERWNQFDFVVVVITVLSNVVPVSFLKAIRVFRFAAKWHNQKVVLSAMLRAIPEFLNVVVLVLAFVFLVAVLGVQLFQGRFSSCNDPDVKFKSECVGNFTQGRIWYEQSSDIFASSLSSSSTTTSPNATTTTNNNNNSISAAGSILTTIRHNSTAVVPRRWATPFYNFDNTPNGLVTSLLLFWNDGWSVVLFNAIDSSADHNVGLIQAEWNTVPVVYFIFFTIIGNFFLHNLFIGTLLDLFKRQHQYEVGLSDEEGNQLLTSEQEQWIRNFRFAQATSLPDPPPPPTHKWRKFCCSIYFQDEQTREDVSTLFEFTVSVAVLINVAFMATEYEGMSSFWESFLYYENLILTIFFAIEVIISFTALLPRAFFDDANNIFNALVTVASFISLRFAGPGINVLRVVRIFRILHVVKRARGVYRLFQALVYSVPQIFNVSVLVVLILYVFGITATQLFGNAYIDATDPDEILGPHYNFKHAGYSILTLIQVATTDGWGSIMEKLAGMTPENSGCVEHSSSVANEGGDLACGNWYAIPFFTLFILVAHSIAINLYIFVIVDNVLELNELNDVRTQWMLRQLADFRKLWMQFDKRRNKQLRWQYLVLILRHMLVMEKHSLKAFRRDIGVPIRVFRSTVEDTLVVESLIDQRSADKHSEKGLELQIRAYYKRLRRRERRRKLEQLRQEFVEREMEKQRKAVEAAAAAALAANSSSGGGGASPFRRNQQDRGGRHQRQHQRQQKNISPSLLAATFASASSSPSPTMTMRRRRSPPGIPSSFSHDQQLRVGSPSAYAVPILSPGGGHRIQNAYEIVLPEELELTSSSSDSDFYEDEDGDDGKKSISSSSSRSSSSDLHEQIRRVKKRRMLLEKNKRKDDGRHDDATVEYADGQEKQGDGGCASNELMKQVKMKRPHQRQHQHQQKKHRRATSGSSSSSSSSASKHQQHQHQPDDDADNGQKRLQKSFSVYNAHDIDKQTDLDRRMNVKTVALSVIAVNESAAAAADAAAASTSTSNAKDNDRNSPNRESNPQQAEHATIGNNKSSNKNNNNNNNSTNKSSSRKRSPRQNNRQGDQRRMDIDDETWCVSEKFLLKRLESLSIPVMKGGMVDYSDCVFGLTRAHAGSTQELSGYAKDFILARVRNVDHSQTFQVHHAVAAMKIWRWWKRINAELEKEMEDAAMDFLLRAALDAQEQQQQQQQQMTMMMATGTGMDRSFNSVSENGTDNQSHRTVSNNNDSAYFTNNNNNYYNSNNNNYVSNSAALAALEALQRAGKMDDLKKAVARKQQQQLHQGSSPNSTSKSGNRSRGAVSVSPSFQQQQQQQAAGGSVTGGKPLGRASRSREKFHVPLLPASGTTATNDSSTTPRLDSTTNFLPSMSNNNLQLGTSGTRDSRLNTPQRSLSRGGGGEGSGGSGGGITFIGGRRRSSVSVQGRIPSFHHSHHHHHQQNQKLGRQQQRTTPSSTPQQLDVIEVGCCTDPLPVELSLALQRHLDREIERARAANDEKKREEEERIAEEIRRRMKEEAKAKREAEIRSGKRVWGHKPGSGAVVVGIRRKKQRHVDNDGDDASAEDKPTAKQQNTNNNNNNNNNAASLPSDDVEEFGSDKNQNLVNAQVGQYNYFFAKTKNQQQQEHMPQKSGAAKSRRETVADLINNEATKNRKSNSAVVTAAPGSFVYFQKDDDDDDDKEDDRLPRAVGETSPPTFNSKVIANDTERNPANKHLGRVQAFLDATRRKQKAVEDKIKKEQEERQRKEEARKNPVPPEKPSKVRTLASIDEESPESAKRQSRQEQVRDFFLDDDNIETENDDESDGDEVNDDDDEEENEARGDDERAAQVASQRKNATSSAAPDDDTIFDDLTTDRVRPKKPSNPCHQPRQKQQQHQKQANTRQAEVSISPSFRHQHRHHHFYQLVHKIAKCNKKFDPESQRHEHYQKLFSFIPSDAPLLPLSVGQLVTVHDTIVGGSPILFGWALCSRVAKPSMRGYVPIDCICDAISGTSLFASEKPTSSTSGFRGDDVEQANFGKMQRVLENHHHHQQQQQQQRTNSPPQQSQGASTRQPSSSAASQHPFQQQHQQYPVNDYDDDDGSVVQSPRPFFATTTATASVVTNLVPRINLSIPNATSIDNNQPDWRHDDAAAAAPQNHGPFFPADDHRGKRAYLLYDFHADHDDVDYDDDNDQDINGGSELAATAGDVVQIDESDDGSGWTRVTKLSATTHQLNRYYDGRRNSRFEQEQGFVPTSYLRILDSVRTKPIPEAFSNNNNNNNNSYNNNTSNNLKNLPWNQKQRHHHGTDEEYYNFSPSGHQRQRHEQHQQKQQQVDYDDVESSTDQEIQQILDNQSDLEKELSGYLNQRVPRGTNQNQQQKNETASHDDYECNNDEEDEPLSRTERIRLQHRRQESSDLQLRKRVEELRRRMQDGSHEPYS